MKLFIVIIIIFLDQLTKLLIKYNLELNKNIKITSFLDIIHIQNKGISFGFFSNTLPSWIILIVVGLIIISLFIWSLRTQVFFEKWGIAIIIAGALGNFIDRLIHNHVIDFIYFHYNKYYWPAFNVADIAISLGIFVLIIGTYMGFKYKVKAKNE